MWKHLLIPLAVLIVLIGGLGIFLANQIYLRHDHQTVGQQAFDTPFPPDAVLADVEFLVATLRKIHPAFEAIGGDEFERRALDLVSGLRQPLTRIELYRRLAQLNGLLADGHTSVRAPAEERDAYLAADGRYIPFTVRISGNGLVVDKPLAEDLNLLAGDYLSTINGQNVDDLWNFSISIQSGESLELRRAYAQRFFYRDLWAAGVNSPFSISVLRDGRSMLVSHDGLGREDYLARRDAQPGQKNSYRLLEPGVGLLTFNHMPVPDAAFQAFLESTFAAIREEAIETLIVDIRENGGGDSRAGEALMRYLAGSDLPAIEYVEVKVTGEIKDYYQTLLPRGFRWIPLHRFADVLEKIRTTPPGETFRLFPDAAEPTEWDSRPESAFDGRLMLLTGPRTYSSAVIFAAPLKHYDRATFIGLETGEPLIFFGENYYFDLPNSKLEAQVSHKKFVLVGASEEGRGIVPDLETEQGEDALAVALDLISGESGALHREPAARDMAALLARFDALVAQFLFDPRLIGQPEWAAFRDAFGKAAIEAENDRQLQAAFDASLAENPLFSHFDLRLREEPAVTTSTPGSVSLVPLAGPTALLTIGSFIGDTVMADINAAFDQAIAMGVDTLVVDLRGNPGGTFAAWPLVARIASEPVTAGYLVAGKWYQSHASAPTPENIANAVPTSTPDLQVLRSDLMDDGLLVLGVEPQAPRFTGAVYVLIDGDSASTSEIIAGTMQFNGLAKVIGENSSGKVLNAEPIPLDDGVTLLLPIADFYLPDGTRLEGRGVTPSPLTPDETAEISKLGVFGGR